MNLLEVTDVGFTGTRKGMTLSQKATIRILLDQIRPQNAHHGDCIGADADFHHLVRGMSFAIQLIGHPPILQKTRAWCDFDVLHPEFDYKVRDRHIVRESQVLLATPKGYTEEARGSGTWLTVRYARSLQRPLHVVYPDGSIGTENL